MAGTHKTSFRMAAEHNDALHDLVERVRRENGWYVGKDAVLRALLDALVRTSPDIDLEGVQDEHDLSERIGLALTGAVA